MHRWACRFKPLPAARHPLLGHYHQLRRHRTVSADQLGHFSPTPVATTPVGLLLQSATNRPSVTTIVGYFGPCLPSIPATTQSYSPSKKLTPPSRAPQASPQAQIEDYYNVNACVYMYAAGHAHFTAAHAIRHLLQPTIWSCYSLVFFRHRAFIASSANTPSILVRARSSPTQFTGPASVFSAPTTSSANTTTSPSRDQSAAAHPSTTTSCVSSNFSSGPTSSGSRIILRRVYCACSRSTAYGSACLQRHATGISAARALSR